MIVGGIAFALCSADGVMNTINWAVAKFGWTAVAIAGALLVGAAIMHLVDYARELQRSRSI